MGSPPYNHVVFTCHLDHESPPSLCPVRRDARRPARPRRGRHRAERQPEKTFLAKKPDALVFSRDSKGNEQRQVYRLDSPTATPVLLTDERRKNDIENFTHARDRMLVATTDVDATGKRDNPNTDLTLLDPLEPTKARKITTLPGTGWGSFSFSFDDKRVAFIQFKSVNETYVWVMDLATGEAKSVLPSVGVAPSGSIATFNVNFARDGKGLSFPPTATTNSRSSLISISAAASSSISAKAETGTSRASYFRLMDTRWR